MEEFENEQMFDSKPIDTDFETISNDEPMPAPDESQEEQEDKIDKYADYFVTFILTFGQLILAAVLLAFGVSAVPAFPFTISNISKMFVFLCGVKFAVAGFSIKRL